MAALQSVMTKAELRIAYKQKRSQLAAAQVSSFNAGILQELFQFNWEDTGFLHTFLPATKLNEPDMWSFITDIRIHYPTLHIVVSRSEPKDYSMQHFLLEEHIVLIENAWGIVEPIAGEPIAETALDVVLVPLLIADKDGNRVGYGKGFYDRFLAKCRPDCKKIGISFFDPVEKIDDVDSLDVPLDILVTPRSTIRFT